MSGLNRPRIFCVYESVFNKLTAQIDREIVWMGSRINLHIKSKPHYQKCADCICLKVVLMRLADEINFKPRGINDF